MSFCGLIKMHYGLRRRAILPLVWGAYPGSYRDTISYTALVVNRVKILTYPDESGIVELSSDAIY